MDGLERAGFLAHARTRGYLAHLERARDTIGEALRLCRKPFVGFSAGKDSSAMLWLVAEQKPDVVAQMLSGGESRILYPSLDGLLAWWRARWPQMEIREMLVDHVYAPEWQDSDWRTQYLSFTDGWDWLNQSEDWDGVFLGLRAEESNKRRMALRARIPDCQYAIYRYQTGGYRICPLDHWTTQDVAALMVQYDMPLLETYQSSGIDARTHLRTGRTALRLGQLVELRQRDPAAYNRLLTRFPELAQWGGG
jgi:3'-phosphoadenosine 5'-phosphosulfate sulfotransferase (PAPS reductase)/FAD synthetase